MSALCMWSVLSYLVSRLPPMGGLALRRTEMIDKVASLFHAWRLETASSHDLALLVNKCMVTATGDLGVESGFEVAPKAHVQTWLPYFDHANLDDDPGLGDIGDAQEDPILDTSSSIYVAGLLHIFSNTAKDILGAAEHWEVVRPQLNALAIFLNRRACRKLFVGVCLHMPPLSYLKPLFTSFPHTLKDWRWEAVWHVCRSLLELQHALTSAWNSQAMLSQPAAELDVQLRDVDIGGGGEEGADGESVATVRQVMGVGFSAQSLHMATGSHSPEIVSHFRY